MTDPDIIKSRILERRERIPGHVAIIMDGNGRWAALRNKPRTFGHEAGVEAVKRVVKACSELDIKYLTLYTFSVENWKRPREEVTALMELLVRTTLSELDELMSNNVRLTTIGNLEDMSPAQKMVIEEAAEQTKDNTGLMLILALNYGGRAEILNAVRSIAKATRAGLIDPTSVTEDLFSEFLYTADIPDPDLLIRTSGERRISNFLIWQTSYTELNIIDTLWPDFGRAELFEAILDYQKRERRFGTVTPQDEI